MRLSTYQNLRLPNFSAQAMLRILSEEDLDWRSALRKAELDVEAIINPGGTIPAKKELAFQLQFAALTPGRVDLWVKLAKSYTLNSFGIRGLAMMSAPTVADWALTSTKMDDGPGLTEVSVLHAPDGRVAGLEFLYPTAPPELVPFSTYREFAFTARMLPWVYDGPFPFTIVEFPFSEISPEVAGMVSCRIKCGSDNLRMWWDPAVSDHLLPFGDAFQHETWIKADSKLLNDITADGNWCNSVRKAIQSMPETNCRLENVSANFGLSPRTLQRKLRIEGYDFAEIRDQILYELACDLLSNSKQSISTISRKLGYTNPVSFTNAFKRWTGTPPSTYRNAGNFKGTDLDASETEVCRA